ncbi:hypothetical protein D3C72_59850 [compost metagenome]
MKRLCLRASSLGVAIAITLASPATAQTLWLSNATPSFQPWLAAGLTYAPMALAAAPGAIHSDPVYPGLQTYGLALAVNPLPGMGQVYAGEPVRGFAILAGSAAMLGAVAVANFAVNRRGRFSEFDPAPGIDPIPYVNIGYAALSGLFSLWAAYDAYQIAERKNAESRPSSLSTPVATP